MSSLIIYKQTNPHLTTYNPMLETDLPENAMGEDLGAFPCLQSAIEAGLQELSSIGEDFPATIEVTPSGHDWLGGSLGEVVWKYHREYQEFWARSFLRDVPAVAAHAKTVTKPVNYY